MAVPDTGALCLSLSLPRRYARLVPHEGSGVESRAGMSRPG